MGRIQNTVHIAQPIAEVFAYAVDPATWPEWDVTVTGVIPPEMPLRVGVVIPMRMRFMGRDDDIERRVLVYEPNIRFVTESRKPFPLTIAWTFAPENAGTRVVRDGELKSSGIIGLLSPVLRRIARRTDQASLERMRLLLEARRSEASS